MARSWGSGPGRQRRRAVAERRRADLDGMEARTGCGWRDPGDVMRTAEDTPGRLSSVAAYPAVVAKELHLFRIVCGGCAAEWAGADRAHCGVAMSPSTPSFCSTSTARAEGACGPRCSVWWQPRTGFGGSRPRHAGWLVDSRRTGAAAGSPLSLSPSPCRPPWLKRGRRACRDCCLTLLRPGAVRLN